MHPFYNTLLNIHKRTHIPHKDEYFSLLNDTITILEHESIDMRPLNKKNLSGGLIHFNSGIPTILVPDIHARTDFFIAILQYKLTKNLTVLDALERNLVRIICLGDGFHSERRGKDRWLDAFSQYKQGNIVSDSMNDEMRESFGLMEMIMESKCAFPQHIHFLKGNHENVLNESEHGNHSFIKFAAEGEMVRQYIEEVYGDVFLERYAYFEKCLPLCAIGERFIASHAEPIRFFTKDELINANMYPDVIEGLTWTNNDSAQEGSVKHMLDTYLPDVPDALYFAGHRPVKNMYQTRAEGRFVQIHNPLLYIIAIVHANRKCNLEHDIKNIQ